MKRVSRLLVFSLVLVFFLNGCNSTHVEGTEDLFQYKDSYVGDSGAVGNILMQLPTPNGEQRKGIELKTKKEPYGIISNYIASETTDNVKLNYRELALYNATFVLGLVKNADWITFNFAEQSFYVTREDLESFYGKDIRQFSNEEELGMFIQEHLEDEDKVNQFLN